MFEALVQHVLGQALTSVQPAVGGMVNQTFRMEAAGRVYLLKCKENASANVFANEAHGLGVLRRHGIRVPQVIAVGAHGEPSTAYLILEWIERGQPSPQSAATLGESLARLHAVRGEQYGAEGAQSVWGFEPPNMPDWVDFFRANLLLPHIRRVEGRLTVSQREMLHTVVDRLGAILRYEGRFPSLLHGDLWSGNVVVAADGSPVLIDPAIYWGDREIELACAELFGGFAPEFFAAYQRVFPLDSGYEYRKHVYFLFEWLNHLALKPDESAERIDTICGLLLDNG